MSNAGKRVRVHYRALLDDGRELLDSRTAGVPIDFVCGAGQMPPALDEAVRDLEPGQAGTFRVPAEQAYGPRREDLVVRRPANEVPGFDALVVGDFLALCGPDGQPYPARVVALDAQGATLDANHWLAGRDLVFELEFVEVLE